MQKKVMPAVLVIVLILLIGAAGVGVHLIQKYTPTKERMDSTEYYGKAAESGLPLIFGTEILGSSGFLEGEEIYIPHEAVLQYLNKRFYWDSNEGLMIYTTPTQKYEVVPDSQEYTLGKDAEQEEYTICKAVGEELYINIKFVKEFSDFDYELLTDPNRLVVQYQWTDYTVVEVGEEDAAVRYQGGIKSPILTNVSKGDKLRLIEELEEWNHVATADGFVGYIQKKDIVGAASVITTERDFQEPEYTSQTRDYKINLAWHQVTSKEANTTFEDTIKDVKGVNVISPTWFSIRNNKGAITNIATKDYVSKAHEKGLEVWGLVDNFSEDISTYEILSHTTTREKLEDNLIKQATRFKLDGINIDFESLAEETGPHFIQFLREMSILCRENELVLSVDNPVPEDFTAHYDRAAQGEVVDYVIVMGYDEHYVGSEEAGSVASLPWVEQGIQGTLEEVPANKVINAVPFYTRVWKTSAGIVTSEAIGMDAVDEVVSKHKVETYWNEDCSQNYGEYYEGKDLYQVWIEDEESLAAKMELIGEYKLAGVAQWKLGFERSSVWDVISKGLE